MKKKSGKTSWRRIALIQGVILLVGLGMLVYAGHNLEKMVYEEDIISLYDFDEEQSVKPASTLSFKRGSYEVTLQYATGKEAICKSYMQTAYGEDYGDTIVLLQETDTKTFELMLYGDVTDFYLMTYEPTLEVTSISVRETNQWNRMLYTMLVLAMMVLDVYLWQKQHHKWESLPAEKKTACLALVLIGIAASVPLFTNYLMSGADLSFHLMRIEGLAEGMRRGSFPVKMQPLWLNDYGYPVSVMYGDLLLYIPALLRLLGFSLQMAYKIYIFGINILTAYISYMCGSRIGKSSKIGIVMSLLYTLSGYRLATVFVRAALGEVTAMAFTPLVLLGLWMLFHEEGEEKQRKSALLLVIGYTGILESHLLSFELIILFSAFYCLINGKKFWRNIKLLVQTAVFTVGINLFYLIPLLDYMLTQDLHVLHESNWNMQETGLLLPQLIQMFPAGIGSEKIGYLASVSMGMEGESLMSAGFPYAVVFAIYVWERLVYKRKLTEAYGESEMKSASRIWWLVVLSAWMSTYLFPWNFIQNIPKIGSMLAPYQFPMRMTAMVLAFGIALGAYVLKDLTIAAGELTGKIMIAGVCLLAVIHSASCLDSLQAAGQPTKVTGYGGIDTRSAVVSGEYLLENSYTLAVNEDEPQTEEGVIIRNYSKGADGVKVLFENPAGKETYIKVPYLSYKGYRAVEMQSGQELTVWHDYYNVAMVVIPAGCCQGEVRVYFEEPIYWRVAEVISLVLVLGSLVCSMKKYRGVNCYR